MASDKRGYFLSFEGGEGMGKSTQIALTDQFLRAAGKRVVLTREPGGTPLGERIRELLLDRDGGMQCESELLLMFAARAEHLAQVIRPALDAGKWVICDRFTDASYAYQGGGRGISAARIAVLEKWVQGALRPDRTFLLDGSVSVGMKRVGRRGERDRFEQEEREFFQRVRASYLERARLEPARFVLLDATASVEEVSADIAAGLEDLLLTPGAE